MEYNKLVRDKIPDIIRASGKIPVTRILDDAEYREQLERKLDEEVAEFHESKSLEELADILEVAFSLGFAHGWDAQQIIKAFYRKAIAKGGLHEKVFLIEVKENENE